jgi:hypothetical protein
MYAVLLISYICDVPEKRLFLSVLGHRCEVNVAKLLYLDDQQTVFFLTSISQILFSKYLVTFLLQSPSSSEVSL